MSGFAYALVIIFLLLSLLHFYWAFGGKWGLTDAIPIDQQGMPVLSVGGFSCSVVALCLLSFALFYYSHVRGMMPQISVFINSLIEWGIPSIFLLRAIGDFNYCGLFKKVRHSRFAKLDSRYFTPLCLLLSVLGFVWMIHS